MKAAPGVCSEVISPQAAFTRYKYYKQKLDNLSVAGIAGPGDALADWQETSQTIDLIHEYDPEVLLCMSTNGLKLPDLAAEIINKGVSHVTVTVNTLNPATGARIYRHVNYRGKRYYGREGAEILLANQLQGIRHLTGQGTMVKINTVMIPGINDQEIPDIVGKMKNPRGVFITNIMPLIPVQGSAFEYYPATDPQDLTRMRETCQAEMRQMFHCQQCRADAVGLLQDHSCCQAAESSRKAV